MALIKKVTFIAHTQHIQELKALLQDMVAPSRSEVGCLQYDIFQLKAQPQEFIVVEAWEHEDALEGHKKSAHYQYYKAHFEPFTAEKYSHDLEML